MKTLEDRFWAKVNKTDGCWEWTAATHKFGYGWIYIGGEPPVQTQAHRVSWEIHNGEIPKGMCVLHKCDNPPCTNPDHLFLGSKQDNVVDMVAKGRQLKGEMNGQAKLTESAVRHIRREVGAGRATFRQLAKKFAVSHRAVQFASDRTNWKYLT